MAQFDGRGQRVVWRLARSEIHCHNRLSSPRGSGGPGATAASLPWIPAFAQGCPGKSSIGETELVLDVGMGRGGIWGLVNDGHRSAFEQARSNQVGKAQGEQARPTVAGGDAQQQIGDHGGKNLQANSVFGTAEKASDFEMLFDPSKQQ